MKFNRFINTTKYLILALFLVVLVNLFYVNDVAKATDGAGLFVGVSKACWEHGTCTLCDILVVVINVADGILRLLGILALVFFLWGVGYLMLSRGNEQQVTRGKEIIKATIIGVVIVLTAWQMMNVIVLLLANKSIFEEKKGYTPFAWYDVANTCSQP